MRGLILSAGLGERLRPLTSTRAKPSVEFLNLPMIGFPYYWLNTMDLTDLVVNTHYQPESVRLAARQVVRTGTRLHFTEEPEILGSGGGIWNAREHLHWDEDFAVANGDGVVAFEHADTLESMLKFHREKKALATLLVCPLDGVGTRIPGVWMDAYGDVAGFGKEAPQPYLKCFHYASFMLLSKRIWNYLPSGPSNILYEVLQPQIAQGEKVYGFRSDDMRWFETGNAADYLRATRECLSLLRSHTKMGDGLKALLEQQASPFTQKSRLDKMWLLADQSAISPSASLNGFMVVGENCVIESGASVENCVLLPGARVSAGETKADQVISANSPAV